MNRDIFGREWNWMELLSVTFHIFAANIRAIGTILMVVFLPISILESIISGRMLRAYTVFQELIQTGVSLSNEGAFFQAAYQVLFHMGLIFAVSLFLQPVGTIAVAKLVKQALGQEKISCREALEEAFALMPTIVVAGILYGIVIFFTSFFIVPGVYFGVVWVFYLCAIGLSGKGGAESLRYSKELVQGKWWKTFGYLLLLLSIAMLWNSAFQLIYVFLPNERVGDVVYQLLCYFSSAFVAVGEALLFLNREAIRFDIAPSPEEGQL